MKIIGFLIVVLNICSSQEIYQPGEKVNSGLIFDENKSTGPVQISTKYKQGKFLIYDCLDRHFVCVNDTSFKFCRSERDNTDRRLNVYLPCAPIKRFINLDLCLAELNLRIYEASDKRFCLSEPNINSI